MLGCSLLVACDPGNDVDIDGNERAAPTPEALAIATEEAIAESLEYEPSADEFEYLGHRDDATPPRRLAPSEDELAAAVGDDAQGDLMDIVTRDGRVYRQRPGTQRTFTSTSSRLDPDGPAPVLGDDADVDPELDASDVESVFRELITGGVDNRNRSTTTSREGVMVKVAGSSGSTSSSCSASMISPRVFLTAAHCVTDSSGDPDWGAADWVMPSARGRSYSGNNSTLDSNDTPAGARQVLRIVKPSSWDGDGARFDYAMLIIGDHAPDTTGSIQWDPEPTFFSTQPCSTLSNKILTLRGYPVRTKTCAAASSEDAGTCGGYAYYESRVPQACSTNALTYQLDSQKAQSGSPLYRYNASTGMTTVVGINKGTNGTANWGHRIRPGSYNLMCQVIEQSENLSSHFTNPVCSI